MSADNNWFVSGTDWWLGERVVALQRAFDESHLIFTTRLNDLVFQSAVVLSVLPPTRRRQYLDWSYEHVTIMGGRPVIGGFVGGYTDPRGMMGAAHTWKQAWVSRMRGNWSGLKMATECAGRQVAGGSWLKNALVPAGAVPYCPKANHSRDPRSLGVQPDIVWTAEAMWPAE